MQKIEVLWGVMALLPFTFEDQAWSCSPGRINEVERRAEKARKGVIQARPSSKGSIHIKGLSTSEFVQLTAHPNLPPPKPTILPLSLLLFSRNGASCPNCRHPSVHC